MNKQQQTELLDSLTKEQRNAIAELILGTAVEGDWYECEDGSQFREDTEQTLKYLASTFSSYDPEMAID